MRKLIWKEFRENLPAGVLALLFFIWLYGAEYLTFRDLMDRALRGELELNTFASPLRSGVYEGATIACALFGLALGWLQTWRERRNKVMEFLAHRPITPGSIFVGKVVVGLAIFAVAAGLPLLSLALWTSRPGNVPAPFGWEMLAPFAVVFANGLLFYFGGMLAGCRRARWYGSLAMPIGLPIIVSTAATVTPHFGLILASWAFAAATLSVAALASFQSFGYDSGRRGPGKPAAVVAIASGWTIAVMMAGLFVADIVERLQRNESWPYYSVRQNGDILKTTYDVRGMAQITDLDGNQVIDPQSGKPMAVSALQFGSAWHVNLNKAGMRADSRAPWISRSFSQNVFWGSGGRSLWYFSEKEQRLLGYDIVTRGFIGSLGPEGFASDEVGNQDRFEFFNSRTLGTKTGLFVPDLQRHTVQKIFSANPSDPIVAVGDIDRDPPEERKTLIATRRSVVLMTLNGRELLRVPFNTPADMERSGFRAFMIQPSSSLLLWSDPPFEPGVIRPNATSQVTWVIDGRIARQAAIPQLRPTGESSLGAQDCILTATMPPVAVALAPTFKGFHWPPQWRQFMLISVIGALVCVSIATVIARRIGLSGKAIVGWALAVICFGLPGLLAFLSIEEKSSEVDPAKDTRMIKIFESPARAKPEAIKAL